MHSGVRGDKVLLIYGRQGKKKMIMPSEIDAFLRSRGLVGGHIGVD